MASEGASPLSGPERTMKTGTSMASFPALPFPPPAPGPPDQQPWEPSPQPTIPSSCSPGSPLVLSAFPNPLLMTGDGVPGPSGAGAGKVIVQVKAEGGQEEPPQTQNFILTQNALNWIASGAPASNVKTILPAQAVGVNQEGPPGLSSQVLQPAAQLAPIVPLEKTWPGPHGVPGEGSPVAAQSKSSLNDLSYTSKGVYENFRRWQCYKALARRHLPQSPDAEALSCFLIPVLRSLARLKPTMTLEEGLPRALQEWEHTSNFDRMIFYEMAEKFMEFEAEEEMQIQNTQLMNESQCLPPAAPLKLDPPAPPSPEVCQQPVYIPKKAASKTRAPRRRQRKSQRTRVPEAPKEIPPEAVQEYASILEGLLESHAVTMEPDGNQEEPQQEEDGMYPDPGLLSYIDELCSQEGFVSKVEAVIHPRFLKDLLSPQQHRDPLALSEELEQEEGLTLAQLVQKRLTALEEDVEAPANCSGVQSDLSPSISDEDEDGGGQLRPSPGPRIPGGIICPGKAASPGKQARERHGGSEQALSGPRGSHKDGDTLPSLSSWSLQLDLKVPQGTREPLGAESRGGSEQVPSPISPHQDGILGGTMSPEHSLVADRTAEAPPFCWQEDLQLEGAPCLDVGLAEPAPLQSQELENQILELQTEQMVAFGVFQGKEHLALSQEGSAEAMWGDDSGPVMTQSYDQDPSPGSAGDRDEVPLSPGLWLSSEMDEVGLDLPFQIEVIENFQDGDCVTEYQGGCEALGSGSNICPCLGEVSSPGNVGISALPCGGTNATATSEERNSSSLPRPLGASSPDLRPKENSEHNPETTQDPSDLWTEGFSPLLESGIDVPTLESFKETLLPAYQGNTCILEGQDAISFPDKGSGGQSISLLLAPTEHISILYIGNDHDFELGEILEDNCPSNFNSYDPQGEDLSKPKDLTPLPRTPKSTSPQQDLGSTSPRWRTKDALVLRETPPVSEETCSSTDGASKKQEEEEDEEEDEEDEELSNFAYLLASKLSLSPRGLPLSSRPTSGLPAIGGQGVKTALYSLSAEVGRLGPPSHPAAKSGKRVLAGGPPSTKKKPHSGAVPEEKSSAGGVARLPQPRKRRRDSFVTGRRKKRRRNQ
ncbi:PREDICTED: NUT family member 1 [Chrysochloris asiatica]|uniref:NUT family member 1 n=1 Tax=Chrysochloris asiatica TaxID=185453 RepID=A0A9B0SWY5_CHRAS|nr:PREDICTED: NUT family member 1 [Chrysochloris asiatica]